MTFENYGSYWQIDHVQPLSAFNLLDENELLKAMNWKNLRPLKIKDNQTKFNKVDKWLSVCQDVKAQYFIKNILI